jgi:hypothetical protein
MFEVFTTPDTVIAIKVIPASKAEKSNTSAKGCWESPKNSLIF